MTTCTVFSADRSHVYEFKQPFIDGYFNPIDQSHWYYNQNEEYTSSEVNIAGTNTVDLTCRKSKTSTKTYKFLPTDEMKMYFDCLEVGEGKKHVYEVGDFMKPHYDLRREDFQSPYSHKKYPHIMTLVVSEDVEPLRVNGTKVCDQYMSVYCVLFTLNCQHEVLPTKSRRISFTFPVYGVYNRARLCKKVNLCSKSIHDIILSRLNSENLQNSLGPVQALIDFLDNEKLSQLFLRYRKYVNDEIPYEREYDYDGKELIGDCTGRLFAQYKKDGVEYEICLDDIDDRTKSMDVTDLVFYRKVDFLDQAKDLVLELKTKVEERYKEVVEKTIAIPDTVDVPNDKCTFTIALSGRYFYDSTLDDLIPIDRAVYEHVKKHLPNREIHFVPSCQYQDPPCYEYVGGQFFLYRSTPTYNNVTDKSPEFNDAGAYNAMNKFVHACLLIANECYAFDS